ncbi:hypothetical protein, partial [Heyndrickxia sporothermodurans]
GIILNDKLHVENGVVKVRLKNHSPENAGDEGKDVYFAKMDWIYHLEAKRFNTKKTNKDWKTFNANVSALAA